MSVALRMYLVTNLTIFAAYSACAWMSPKRLAGWVDIELQSVTAVADFRAMYGGMCLGAGFIFALGFLRHEWRVPAVLLAVTTAGGLLLARLWTALIEGPVGSYIHAAMVLEVLAVIIGIALLRHETQHG